MISSSATAEEEAPDFSKIDRLEDETSAEGEEESNPSKEDLFSRDKSLPCIAATEAVRSWRSFIISGSEEEEEDLEEDLLRDEEELLEEEDFLEEEEDDFEREEEAPLGRVFSSLEGLS